MAAYRVLLLSSLVGLSWAVAGPAQALGGQVLVSSGLDTPLQITAPLGDARLFAVEKGGVIRLLSGGAVQGTPFLDLSAKVATEGERGLLGLAFDPGFASNGRFYVNYIDKTTLNTVVERYQVAPGGNVANAASAQTILNIAQPGFSNHKGGWMGFRPGDAQNLYIATGDGGGGNDPSNHAQNPQSLLGKMLRIDVSGNTAGYAIASSNPFAGSSSSVREEIWALGLRNPFRNSFDRQTGELWIADVGQGAREEINFEALGSTGGLNYGWRLREGSVPTPGVGGSAAGMTEPIFDYAHGDAGGLGDSIIGGYVYRGPSIAGADGRYFFGDFVSNSIFSFALGAGGTPTDLRNDTAAWIGGTGLQGLASFGEDGQGRLYAVGVNGVVVQLVPEPQRYALMLLGLLGLGVWARRRPGA